MEAPLVRAYLGALPDLPSDGKVLERVRFCLASLQSPDVRYLVATLLGPGAPVIARVAAAVLRAAGAPTAVVGPDVDATTIDGAPIDDGLLGRAGTLTAAAGYQLADAGRDLGQLTRREAGVILALTAAAEASQRVVLLVDEGLVADDAAQAPRPDLVVVGTLDDASTDAALALVPPGRPVVLGAPASAARAAVEAKVDALGVPALIGGRDHRLDERDGRLVFSVRDEPYVTIDAVSGIDTGALATGIATALALGVMGIRMREDWVIDGIAALRATRVAS